MKLLILSGSYRPQSNGKRVVAYVKSLAEKQGYEVDIADAKTLDLPMIEDKFANLAEDKKTPEMLELKAKLEAADAFVVVSAEYNYTMPPGLVNMMDYFRDEYGWRPAGMVTYSIGPIGGLRAAMHLRDFIGAMSMSTIPTILSVGSVTKSLDESGALIEDAAGNLPQNADRFFKELTWFAESFKVGREKGTPFGLFS